MFNKIWRSSIVLLALVAVASWLLLTQTNIENDQQGEVLGVNSLDLAESSDDSNLLSARGAWRLINSLDGESSLTIIDIRTQDEFLSGHISGAQNLDYFSSDFNLVIDALDKTQPYLIYSESSQRGNETYSMMQAKEFEEVYYLVGGIRSWQVEGFDLEQE